MSTTTGSPARISPEPESCPSAAWAPWETIASSDSSQPCSYAVACIASAVRGRALWKIGDRSLIAKHHRPPALHALTDTDGMMRRDSLIDEDRAA